MALANVAAESLDGVAATSSALSAFSPESAAGAGAAGSGSGAGVGADASSSESGSQRVALRCRSFHF